MALLSRATLDLLTLYMNYERQQNADKFNGKTLFLRTAYEKLHWMSELLNAANDDALSQLDRKVYQFLRLLRMVYNAQFEHWPDLDSVGAEVVPPESALELCHIELKKQKIILQFLDEHEHNGKFDHKILVENCIVQQLLSLRVNFSMETHEEIQKLFHDLHEFNQRQLEISNRPTSRNELELLNEYMILKLHLDLILSDDSDSDNLQHARSLLRTINDGTTLFLLVQNVFTLTFLRFEHVQNAKRKRMNSEAQSGNASSQTNSHPTDVSDPIGDMPQSGFMCLGSTVNAIVNSLRRFLMELDQLEVYRSFDDELKIRFELMLKNVDDALWRMQILANSNSDKLEPRKSVKSWVKFHCVPKQADILSDISGDESETQRRKVKRKKQKRRPGDYDENYEASGDSVHPQPATETSKTDASEKQSMKSEPRSTGNGFFSSVLMSPESLLARCMIKNDLENAQKVIKVS